ncbi:MULTISPECIES: MarR family transcriptional regulator [Microbacterium]|uniref:MarR family winged helix-turn-helix transcriptional regulator n=1 Tax=Microbacterium TaxID=33882 RepID=UPI001CB72290|nr:MULTISPECIES: MarR family transcriptional regulator [Microbacterium]
MDAEVPAPVDAAPGASGNGVPAVREATMLLRTVIEMSDLFEKRLQSHLTVNPTDLEAMEHLLSSGPLGPSDLARRLHISTASTTAMVDRLVALGHVTREPHPTDRRAVLIVPTETSRRSAMSVLMPMILGVDAVLDRYTPDERSVITNYLAQVVDEYRSHATPGQG